LYSDYHHHHLPWQITSLIEVQVDIRIVATTTTTTTTTHRGVRDTMAYDFIDGGTDRFGIATVVEGGRVSTTCNGHVMG